MIILFGSTGMLGRYIYNVLKNEYDIICISRIHFNITKGSWIELENIIKQKIINNKNNYIINCAGIIPQKTDINDYYSYIKINTLFPIILQNIAEKYECKMIHITTDCIYDGKKGKYLEGDECTEKNLYGISKSLGEPDRICCIRTSIIGEELFGKKSLLEWVKSNKNKIIDGYINYYWNGVTCLTLANIIKQIIDKNIYWCGTRHIFSPDTVSKYDLCYMINEIYDLNIKINKKNLDISINKSLDTWYKTDLNLFNIKRLKEQIQEQKDFILL